MMKSAFERTCYIQKKAVNNPKNVFVVFNACCSIDENPNLVQVIFFTEEEETVTFEVS